MLILEFDPEKVWPVPDLVVIANLLVLAVDQKETFMSGVKDSYVQLRQSQLDHLMKNCNRVGNLEADIAKRVKDNQLLQQQMDSQRRQEEQRHKQLESQLGQMSSHMQEAEKESQRKIKKLRDKFNADLQGVNQRIDQLGSVLNKRGAGELYRYCKR